MMSTAAKKLPAGAWDSHVHVFDSTLGPFSPSRSYTPAQAPLSQLLDFSTHLSVGNTPSNLVIVQPSPYGFDNTILLSLLKAAPSYTTRSVRGIAVIDIDKVGEAELISMHELGVRGLRLNAQASGHAVDIEAVRSLMVKSAWLIKDLPGWKLQIFAPAYIWDDLYDCVHNLPVTVILDHLGGLKGASKLSQDSPHGVQQRGFTSIVKLAQESKVLVKISGLYRASTEGKSGYSDLEPIIRKLAKEVPDRLIWGSDWPHTGEGANRLDRNLEGIEPFRVIDNGLILKNLWQWVDCEKTWRKMMVETPAATYI
ncbi:hypothetical protein F5X98DRAFT_27393 [Xylaria grammica]|nr:hypothetical protein F5X98DRAFT_27393 [Xylaria grammica]